MVRFGVRSVLDVSNLSEWKVHLQESQQYCVLSTIV